VIRVDDAEYTLVTPKNSPSEGAKEVKLSVPPRSSFGVLTTRNRASRGKSVRVKGRSRGLMEPPEISTEVQCKFRGYFGSAGVTNGACTRATIAGALGIVAQSSTTCVAIATSFRIRRITIWSSSVAGTVNDSFVSWATSTGEQALIKDDQKIKPVVGGTVPPGPMVFSPPKGSYAAMWQRANSTASPSEVLMNITMGGGTILLLEADFTMGSAIQALVSAGAVIGLTAGMYYRYSLDTTGTGNVIKSLVASAF